MFEDRLAVANDRHRRMEHMHLPTQELELVTRRRAVGGFRESPLPQRQRLVRSQHEPAWRLHRLCLLARQQCRNRAGIGQTGVCLDATFVDIGGRHVNRDSGTLKQKPPAGALRCKQ